MNFENIYPDNVGPCVTKISAAQVQSRTLERFESILYYRVLRTYMRPELKARDEQQTVCRTMWNQYAFRLGVPS